jgi:hypothetical protein
MIIFHSINRLVLHDGFNVFVKREVFTRGLDLAVHLNQNPVAKKLKVVTGAHLGYSLAQTSSANGSPLGKKGRLNPGPAARRGFM